MCGMNYRTRVLTVASVAAVSFASLTPATLARATSVSDDGITVTATNSSGGTGDTTVQIVSPTASIAGFITLVLEYQRIGTQPCASPSEECATTTTFKTAVTETFMSSGTTASVTLNINPTSPLQFGFRRLSVYLGSVGPTGAPRIEAFPRLIKYYAPNWSAPDPVPVDSTSITHGEVNVTTFIRRLSDVTRAIAGDVVAEGDKRVFFPVEVRENACVCE